MFSVTSPNQRYESSLFHSMHIHGCLTFKATVMMNLPNNYTFFCLFKAGMLPNSLFWWIEYFVVGGLDYRLKRRKPKKNAINLGEEKRIYVIYKANIKA